MEHINEHMEQISLEEGEVSCDDDNISKGACLNMSRRDRRCVLNFSLYADLVSNDAMDPEDIIASFNIMNSKLKSKTSKKQSLRQRNRKRSGAVETRPFKIDLQVVTEKRRKKDMKKLIKGIERIPTEPRDKDKKSCYF